jgi:ribosome-associated protein
MEGVVLPRGTVVPEREIALNFARSCGPGGQKVDTSATKVELRFHVDDSEALDEAQKARVQEALRNRITRGGELVLTASEHRSQERNREAVITRFAHLLGEAIQPPKPRRATRPSKQDKRRRLEAKRRQSEKKRLRRPPDPSSSG